MKLAKFQSMVIASYQCFNLFSKSKACIQSLLSYDKLVFIQSELTMPFYWILIMLALLLVVGSAAGLRTLGKGTKQQ